MHIGFSLQGALNERSSLLAPNALSLNSLARLIASQRPSVPFENPSIGKLIQPNTFTNKL